MLLLDFQIVAGIKGYDQGAVVRLVREVNHFTLCNLSREIKRIADNEIYLKVGNAANRIWAQGEGSRMGLYPIIDFIGN